MEKPNSEQWQKIEENVNDAEEAQKKSRKASRELYRETGTPKTKRGEEEKEAVSSTSKRKRVIEKVVAREEDFEREAEDILGQADSSERALVKFRKENLVVALRKEREIKKRRAELLEEESEILKEAKEEPTGSEQEALKDIRAELAQLEKDHEELLTSSPEAYIGLHLKELKEYKKDLKKGRIAELPYVKRQAEDIVAHLRANKPVLIYGHLGSGKTELAMHIAREYIGKEAVVISGSKNMSLAELYGHQMLTVDKETGSTVSDFFLGPIYRAMEEGRPVIIDEVNAIPHEVLISLNHILTRQVGEKVNVQQNTGSTVTIKEGFGIIMTGNLNQGQERYVDRQDMDPAFLSRLYKLEYDYLPQKTEGSMGQEAGDENELFHLMIARIMDQNGNIEAPKDAISKLWNLAKAARVTQDVFAGREVSNAFYFQEAGSRPAKYLLKESVLSIRAIDNILTQWQKDGYKQELDYYLWKEFVSQSTVAPDKAYLYQILKDRFGFFVSDGWEQNPSYGSGGVVNSFDMKAPQNPPAEKEFFGPRDTIRFAYGTPPERIHWPEADAGGKHEADQNLEALESLEEFKTALEKNVAELEKEVGEFCNIEGKR